MLKLALARGEPHCVAPPRWMNTVSTLKRRGAGTSFSKKCFVAEPSVEDVPSLFAWPERTLRAATTCRSHLAIVAAATSHRYIADRQLPDKAIDLIDEAASSIRMQIDL